MSTNTVTTVVSTVYDTDSDVATIYCKNTSSLDGGQDEDSLEDLRSNATNTFQSGERAVSRGDYETKFKETSYVQNAVVWGAYEENIINNRDPWYFLDTDANVVHVSAYTPSGEQLSPSQQRALILYVNDDKPPEDIIQFTDVEFIYLTFHIDAYISDTSYVPSDVKSDIITALTTEYALDNMDFYEHIYETTWNKVVTDIAGVDHHDSYISLLVNTTFTSAYVMTATTLSLTNIKTSSVRIYVDGTLIGTDDGLGGYTAETGYTLSGSINYGTGVMSLTVDSGLSGAFANMAIKIYYRTLDSNNKENLMLNKINQIFKISEVTDVDVSYL